MMRPGLGPLVALTQLGALLALVPGLHARRPVSASTKCGAARVAISVSPLVRSKELRTLELSWKYERAQPGDQVALYDYDPVSRQQWDSEKNRNEPIFDAAGGSPGSSPNIPYPSTDTRGGSSFAGPVPPPGGGPDEQPYAYDPYGGRNSESAGGYPGAGGFGGAGRYQGPGRQPGMGDYSGLDPGASSYPGAGTYQGERRYPSAGGNPAGGHQGGSAYPYGGQGSSPSYGAGPGVSSLFPAGYPRDAFSGRARREAEGTAGAGGGGGGGPPLAVVSTDGLQSGWRATNVQETHVPSGQLGYKSRCLNYWVVYERPRAGPTARPDPYRPASKENETEVLAVSCLRTRPTWMSDFRSELGRLRLVDLFIPGTHDSASIQEDGRNNIIDRYTVTQDESILGQLIYGVRYIDLRVGFYSNKDVQWWANHGPVRMQPLQSVLHDVKAFMDNTNEIVILDLQNFPAGFGKDNKVHHKLVHLLETELGELMAFREQGWDSRLEEMWTSGRRLIVAYDKEDVLPASRKLWPAVRQFWGDAQTPEQLNKFATSIMSQQYLRGFPWALMAELTPNARLIATSPTGSLRRLAHLVNRNVSAWAEGSWGEAMNTLAVDFIRSTGVVEAAIWHNLRRAGVDVCNAHRLVGSV